MIEGLSISAKGIRGLLHHGCSRTSSWAWPRASWVVLVAACLLSSCQSVHRCWFVVDADVGRVERFAGLNPGNGYIPRVAEIHVLGDHGLQGDVFALGGLSELVRAFPMVIQVEAGGVVHEWRRVDSFQGLPVGYQPVGGGDVCWICSPADPVGLWFVERSGERRQFQVAAEGLEGAFRLVVSPVVRLVLPPAPP